MKLRNVAILCLLVAVISAATARYFFPQIRIEEKETVRRDVRTIIREVVKEDGSHETITEIIDRSKEEKKNLQLLPSKKDWFFTVSHGAKDFTKEPEQSVGIYRRILGPGVIGLTISTSRVYSVNVGLEF